MEKKTMKVVADASVVVGIAAAIGLVTKELLKKSVINDPSTSLMNYGKWVLVLSGSMMAKNYLEDKGVLPKPT